MFMNAHGLIIINHKSAILLTARIIYENEC